MGLEIGIIIFIMGMAILLFLLEIFLLPGVTVAGIAGALFAVTGIVYAYSINVNTGNITLGSSIVVFSGLFLWLLRTNSFQRVALKTNVDSTLQSPRDEGLQIGDQGFTISRLAPIGKARFGDVVVEAKTIADFIDEKTDVVIVQIEGYNVIVESIQK